MEAPKSYTIRTETGELRLMSQEEVGVLVRSTMEKAKATPPSPRSPASATSPRLRNPYTSTSQRLSRTPKRGARKFHFRLTPEAKKSNDEKQAAIVAESTSNSSREKDLECRSERPTGRSRNKSQRCPTDEALEAHEQKPVMEQELSARGFDEEQPKTDATKKNLSEVEIGDLVRNSIRRARENAKEKTPQQLALAQKITLANNEICTSPVAKQLLSWSSNEERRTHNEGDFQTGVQGESSIATAPETDLQPAEEALECLNPIAASVVIPKINSIVEVDDENEEQTSIPRSPPNQPSVVSESQSHFSRAFRSFFHGPFQSRDQSDEKNELLNTQVTVETKNRVGSYEKTLQEHLRVDIPSYSDVKDEQPSLNRIVQETMRRARETAEESVLECRPFRDPCEVENGFDASSYVSKEGMIEYGRASIDKTKQAIAISEDTTRPAATPEFRASEENSVMDAGDEGSNETRITEALDISDVDSEVEDLSHQRSLQSNYGPFAGCCGVQSVLPSTTQQAEPESAEPIELMTIHYDQTGKSLEKKPTVAKTGAEDDCAKCSIDPPEGEITSDSKGPTLEEVVIKLMKSETTAEADSADSAHSSEEAAPDHAQDDQKVTDKSNRNRSLLKLKVSCSSDEEYPTAREVRRSLSASLQRSTSKSLNRTRSVSDFKCDHRRARTLSSRSRRYRRSLKKSRDPSPQAHITDEFLADLTKQKGKKITIDELKRMLKVPDIGSEDESRKGDEPSEHRVTSYTQNQLQPRTRDSTAISTHFCMDIWDLFQPFEDIRRLSDDDCGPLEEYHSAADLESAAEDTTSVETTTFCDTDADAQPNPRMTFSFSARGGSTSSDDSTIIGW